MSTSKDGGPAFPSSPVIGPNGVLLRPADIGCEGLSLRDWFAGQALSGITKDYIDNNVDEAKVCSEQAYRIADAMLAARSKENQP